MFTRLFRAAGLATPDDVIGFLVCGMTALPTFLFIAGEPNLAAVVMLVLFNALMIFGLRTRERENLQAEIDEMRRQVALVRNDEEPRDPHG